MSDITYTIGATDKASAPMQKVESSMSRLEKSTKSLGEASQRSLSKIDISFQSLLKGAGIMKVLDIGVQAVGKAFASISGTISSANAAYDTQIEAVKGLETALRLSGEEVENQSAKLQSFASDLQALTGVGDEVTLKLMRQASMLGVGADQLDDAAKAAIGLAEATGKSLDESLKLVQSSLEGEFGAFGKIIPAIKSATTETEKLALIQDLATKGMEAKIDSSNRLAGAEERAAGAVGDLMEQVGALLAPIRQVIAIGIKAMAEALTGILTPAAESVQAMFQAWMPTILATIESLVNGIIGGLTMAEVIFTNFGDVVSLVLDTIKLKYETYRADTEHLFVTTIPAYVQWFGDNFFEIINTAFSAASAVITNHITKIIATFTALWDFIASGGSSDVLGQLGEIAGRSYLEGFENTIGELPNVLARNLTGKEQELQNSIAQTSGNLASQFMEKFNARAIKLGDKVGSDVSGAIDLQLKQKGLSGSAALAGAGGSNPLLSGSGELSAMESRLLTRGPVRRLDPQAKTNELLEEIKLASQTSMSELKNIKAQLAGDGVLLVDAS